MNRVPAPAIERPIRKKTQVQEPFNPYDPPKTPVLADPEPHSGGELVSGWKRFLNSLVDGVVLYLVGIVLGVLTALVVPRWAHTNRGGWWMGLINISINYIYFVSFEYFLNRTPAKFLTRTIVVNGDGRGPSFVQILGRSAARFIPFDCFTFFGSQTRGWHDSLSNTFVVSTRRS